MQLSPEEVVEGHSSSLTDGLSTAAVASLRRIHGLNKLEGEVKVLRQNHILYASLDRNGATVLKIMLHTNISVFSATISLLKNLNNAQ